MKNTRMRCEVLAVAAAVSALAVLPRLARGDGACATTSFLTGSPGCTVVANQAGCDALIGVYVGDGTTCTDIQPLYIYPNGGQINFSGATLFANFFEFPAATNDYINVDGDAVP